VVIKHRELFEVRILRSDDPILKNSIPLFQNFISSTGVMWNTLRKNGGGQVERKMVEDRLVDFRQARLHKLEKFVLFGASTSDQV
jgi:hypothetical protein